MTLGPVIRRLCIPLVALFLVLAPLFAAVHAAEQHRRVAVVSFGLFGPQGVFRREATAAADIVASRFGAHPVVVRFNTKTGGDATVQTLAATLQAEATKMNGGNDVLFLILTSHGSPDGLAINAGRVIETLQPSNLAQMLERTGVRHKVVVISAAIPESSFLGLLMPIHS